MSALRTLKRGVIRTKCYQKNGNTRSFEDEWERIHYGRTEEVDDEGKVVSTKSNKVERRKQRHFDDGKAYVKHLKAVKSFVDSMRNKTQNKSNMNAKAKVC